jgi:undecaprenyl-diphosphatase
VRNLARDNVVSARGAKGLRRSRDQPDIDGGGAARLPLALSPVGPVLGVLEGLTEFIPVSSTGHLLLAGHFLGFESTGKTFEVLIQLGAILALLGVYAGRLWAVARDLPTDPAARRFVLAVLLAFLPAAIIGVLAHDFIKTVLFETPMVIAWSA